jgi:hypothetical protein
MIAGIAKRLISWVVIRFKIYILFNFNSSVNSTKLHYFLKTANIFLFFLFQLLNFPRFKKTLPSVVRAVSAKKYFF